MEHQGIPFRAAWLNPKAVGLAVPRVKGKERAECAETGWYHV